MNLAPILPELILTIGAIVLMMVAAFTGKRVRVKDFSSDQVLAAQVAAAIRAGRPDVAGTGVHLHVDRFRDRNDRWTVRR